MSHASNACPLKKGLALCIGAQLGKMRTLVSDSLVLFIMHLLQKHHEVSACTNDIHSSDVSGEEHLKNTGNSPYQCTLDASVANVQPLRHIIGNTCDKRTNATMLLMFPWPAGVEMTSS